jgi:hypothetical protein
MRRGSSNANVDLISQLERIKDLLEASIDLARSGTSRKVVAQKRGGRPEAKKGSSNRFDFSKPIRPFIKQHAGRLSGPKKFTLVLAHLSGGDASKKVTLEDIQTCWNRMTEKGLLGMKFNRFYSAQAKNNDWVNTEKSGRYYLRPSWKDIFHEGH